MNIKRLITQLISAVALFSLSLHLFAAEPVWTILPLTKTTQSVPSNSTALIKYRVTNKSSKAHLLQMQPIEGIVQITKGKGVCGNPFWLPKEGSSCVLTLLASGSALTIPVVGGPIICQQGSELECYRPAINHNLILTQDSALNTMCKPAGPNNTECKIDFEGQTNFGFTNMTYALCRSAQCDYTAGDLTVSCSCKLIAADQGIYSASVAPHDYSMSKPVGSNVTSTYSMVDSSDETPTECASGPFANCFGATCTVSGSTVTCTCPVDTDTYIAPETDCNPGNNKIWSATSVSSFPAIETSMLYMYNTYFINNLPG